jgi:hypothetical protein
MNGAPKWTLTGDKIPNFFPDFRDFCEIQGLFPTVKSVNRIPGLFPVAWEPWVKHRYLKGPAIEIYSLPVSTANGIKFRFQFY